MNKKITKENCNKLVVKHNKLIEFKGRMTTSELKLFSLVIADIRDQQKNILEKYEIDISVLREISEHKDFYNYIKAVAFKLEEKSIEVENINEKGKKESFKMRLINRPLIVEDSNYLEVLIDKELIPYVIDLKREFTRYEIENILRLKSNYSIRVYELLKQYENIGKREISIKHLRKYLGILNDEYSRFYDFEKRVLVQAKEEINKNTDIVIDYQKVKTGRRISSVSFIIQSNNIANNQYIKYLNENYNIEEIKEMSGLKNEKLNSKQVMDLYEISVDKTDDENVSPFEYIKLNYLLMIEKKKVRNKFAYLKKALEEDYAVAIGQLKFDIKV